jgi:MFS transporter, OFA family, oxalate/formate antiporter
MKKYLTVIASFIIMSCLGGVYAWSLIATELIQDFQFSSSQTQLIFGMLIAVYPVTMIFAGKLEQRIKARILAIFSAVFFSIGYLIAARSNGNFTLILLGIGIMGGIGTGLGYLVSLTIPVRWFPNRKGLITGIASAGFGFGAILLSSLANQLFQGGKNILEIFEFIAIAYGILLLIVANFISSPKTQKSMQENEKIMLIKSKLFRKLFIGIFLGTFAGLLVVGSLKLIGVQHNLSQNIFVLGVSLFSLANFLGRLIWGYISDFVNTSFCIFLSLTIQAIAIFLIGTIELNSLIYLSLAFITGFGFGGNFVLFAKETSQQFGVEKLSLIYPFIFIGYAIAGIAGPLTGGILYDTFGSFFHANMIAAALSFLGGLIFLFQAKMTRQQK